MSDLLRDELILECMKTLAARSDAEVLDLVRSYRANETSLIAASHVRANGGIALDPEMLSNALSCPFLVNGEAENWEAIRDGNVAKAKSMTEPRVGFVYLMRNARNGLIKIGFSLNPKYREATLQAEEPEIEIITTAAGTVIKERELHLRFADQRVRGEWFKLSEEELETAKELL